jgi:hypothetical protein
MKNDSKMNRQIVFTVLLFLCTTSFSQYNFTVGLRAGGTSGFTVKKIMGSESAVEGILGFCGDCFSITGLFEKQPDIPSVEGLSWFYGAGMHLAFYQGRSNGRWLRGRYYDDDNGALGIGIDGVIGIEYKIPDVPLAFSLDFKPFIEITTRNRIWFWPDAGFGIKLAFSI